MPIGLLRAPLTGITPLLLQQMLTDMEELFKPPTEPAAVPEQRRVVLHMSNAGDVEAAAQAEAERLAALDAAAEQDAAAAGDAPPATAAAADEGETVRVAFGPDGSLQLSVTPAATGARWPDQFPAVRAAGSACRGREGKQVTAFCWTQLTRSCSLQPRMAARRQQLMPQRPGRPCSLRLSAWRRHPASAAA